MSYSYDRSAAQDSDADEVLSSKEIRESLDSFLNVVIREGQKLHWLIDKQWDWVSQNVQGGDKISKRDVVQAVARAIEPKFGNDPLAKALARAIALGEGLL